MAPSPYDLAAVGRLNKNSLIGSSMWVETIKVNDYLYISRGVRLEFPNHAAFLSLKIVFILANSAYPNKMPHYAAFHLGLHCLPKHLFMSVPHTKS